MTKTTKLAEASETEAETKPKAKARSGGSGPWGELQQIEATGCTFADATQIEATGAWTVVMILAKDGQAAKGDEPEQEPQQGVILPIDAAIGDLVELCFTGYVGQVFTAEGDRFHLEDEERSIFVGSSAIFRKVEEKVWRFVAGS